MTLASSVHTGKDRRKQPPLRRISPLGIEIARSFHEMACSLCSSDRYNLILHKHLGDVVNVLAAKACFEDLYKAQLRFLVRPQHAFLMSMYGIDDYAVLDIDALVKCNKRLHSIYFGASEPSAVEIDRLENNLYQAIFCCVPIRGVPFVCENVTNDFFAYDRYWAFRWAANMGIEDCTLALPTHVPKLSRNAERALSAVASLQRIVLFAPDAATAEEFDYEFWDIIADAVHERGFTIVVNSTRITVKHAIPVDSLGLDLADVVALGYACANVFSVRSGLCDALVGIGARLYAFYPAMLRREAYGLNGAFAVGPGVYEACISQWKVDQVTWHGFDLTPALQGHVDKHYRRYRRGGWIQSLPLIKTDERRRSSRHRLEMRFGFPFMFTETNRDNLPRSEIVEIAGLRLFEKTFHFTPEGGRFTRRSLLFGLLTVVEWADGSWQSFFLKMPLSASDDGTRRSDRSVNEARKQVGEL